MEAKESNSSVSERSERKDRHISCFLVVFFGTSRLIAGGSNPSSAALLSMQNRKIDNHRTITVPSRKPMIIFFAVLTVDVLTIFFIILGKCNLS